MPMFLVETRKATQEYGGAKWSNRYFTTSASLTEALAQGADLWNAHERTFHYDWAYCYEVYANQVGDTPYTPGQTQAIAPGTSRGFRVSGGLAQAVQSWTVVRVDFPVFASRPSRKFYRLPLREADVEGDTITDATLVGAMQSALNDLALRNFLVDIDGQGYTGAALIKGLTSRRLGKFARINIPPAPPQG